MKEKGKRSETWFQRAHPKTSEERNQNWKLTNKIIKM